MTKLPFVISLMLLLSMPAAAVAQNQSGNAPRSSLPPAPVNPVSPALRIERVPGGAPPRPAPLPAERLLSQRRSIDGRDNNRRDPDMGAANTPLLRLMDSYYGDAVSAMAGAERPGARVVSNIVCAQENDLPSEINASDFVWQWGQFLDHDIDLTGGVDPPEAADIPVPQGDAFFDPFASGTAFIALNRSIYDPATGTSADNPRQQLNEVTAWIDASNVYGSDAIRAAALRENDGTGRLRTSAGRLLPFNTDGLSNAGGSDSSLFLAGDVRANEQVGLTAMHTLFVREHNRLAAAIRSRHPRMTGDEVYERARQIVGAEIQAITYNEFLPVLLGPGAIAPYRGYDANVDARIANIFSSAAYRYGHSQLNPTLLRLDRRGDEIPAGHLALRDAFFAPQRITDEGGIDPILRGLASQVAQAVDPYVVDDVRNFLFGPPGAGGFDLAALNIQRGRDHGLPSYNDTRAAFGLSPAATFADVSSDAETQERLAAAYDSVDDVDVWVGGLAEDPMPGAQVGELVYAVLKNQFEALRDGDRFWYQRTLPPSERMLLERTRLSDVIRRNTGIRRELQDDVFHAP